VSKTFHKVVDVLLEFGADTEVAIQATRFTSPYAAFTVGWTTLHLAASGGDEQIVKTLLSAGANIAAKSRDGTEPLYVAGWLGHANIVEILLAAGADISARTPDGLTALHEASNRGNEK